MGVNANSDVYLFLPDGTILPASSANRQRAEKLWLSMDSEIDLNVNVELSDDCIQPGRERNGSYATMEINGTELSEPSKRTPETPPVPVPTSPISTPPAIGRIASCYWTDDLTAEIST